VIGRAAAGVSADRLLRRRPPPPPLHRHRAPLIARARVWVSIVPADGPNNAHAAQHALQRNRQPPTLTLTATLSPVCCACRFRRCWSAVWYGAWRAVASAARDGGGVCGADGGAVAAGYVARICGHSAARRNGGGGGTRVAEHRRIRRRCVRPRPRPRARPCAAAAALRVFGRRTCSPPVRVCNCSIARHTGSVSRVCTSSPMR
jgi:hypothetical protein